MGFKKIVSLLLAMALPVMNLNFTGQNIVSAEIEVETPAYTSLAEPISAKASGSEALYRDVLNKLYQHVACGWTDYTDTFRTNGGYGTREYLASQGITLTNNEFSYQWSFYESGRTLSQVGYLFFDVNGDGIDEMAIGLIDDSEAYDLYTYYNGNIVHLATGGERDRFYIGAENDVWEIASGGAAYNVKQYYHVSQGKLQRYEVYVQDGANFYYGTDYDKNSETIINKRSISELQYNSAVHNHIDTPFSSLSTYLDTFITSPKSTYRYALETYGYQTVWEQLKAKYQNIYCS